MASDLLKEERCIAMKFIKSFSSNILKSFVIASIVASFVTFIIAGTVNARVGNVKIDNDKLNIEPKPTKIYDAYGNQLASFERDRKELVTYDQIPAEIIEGFVATEDRAFFQHAGINVQATFRAVLIDLKTGNFEQGGSTITQQLIKRVYLNPGKTLQRKEEEAVYATALEQSKTKKEILSNYLSQIYYGNRAYGIKSAIDTYFGQTISQFNKEDEATRAAKAALLAGIPNAPSLFNPYTNPKQALQRRNAVLTNMYTQGYISETVYKEAMAKGFLILPKPKTFSDDEKVQYPEFVHYVLEEAKTDLNLSSFEEAMYSGLKIYTSFNPDIYNAMRKHMSDGSLYPSSTAPDGKIAEGAAVFMNPQNGEIYALTGSREQVSDFTAFNRAFQAYRQPGSSIKPLLDYGPALEKGIMTPYSAIPCTQDFGDYHVKNDAPCGGSMTVAEALRISENSTAVWTLNKVGIGYAKDFIKKLGIELSPNDIYLPIAIGGLEKGITPLQEAGAYQVYANNGVRFTPHTIRRMVNVADEVVYQAPSQGKQVIKQSTARNMRNLLRSVVTSGTGRNANIPEYDISGKTGTNELPSGYGNKDIWFSGYTDNLEGTVWMGYDITDSTHYIPNGQTSYVAAKMWAEIAQDVFKILPKTSKSAQMSPNMDIKVYHSTDANSVKVEWNAQDGVNYEVYRDGMSIGDTNNGSYEDTSVEQGKTYTYKVIGYDTDSGKKIKLSNSVSIQLPIIDKKNTDNSNNTTNTGDNQQQTPNNEPTQNQNPSANPTTTPDPNTNQTPAQIQTPQQQPTEQTTTQQPTQQTTNQPSDPNQAQTTQVGS